MDFLSISLCIVAVTCFVSYIAFSNQQLFKKFVFSPYQVIHSQQSYRCFSHGLIHAGWIHLLLNMYVLYSFGSVVEKYFALFSVGGRFLFLVMYVLALPVSCLLSFSKKDDIGYSAVGASGAVNAVVFSYVVLNPWAKLYFFVIPMPSIVFAVLYIGYSYYMSYKNTEDGIGHDAHFVGALFGMLFTFCTIPNSLPTFISKLLSVFN